MELHEQRGDNDMCSANKFFSEYIHIKCKLDFTQHHLICIYPKMKLPIAVVTVAILSSIGQILALEEPSVGTRRLKGPPPKVTICHYIEEDAGNVEITVSSKAKGHQKGKHGDCDLTGGKICDMVAGCVDPTHV